MLASWQVSTDLCGTTQEIDFKTSRVMSNLDLLKTWFSDDMLEKLRKSMENWNSICNNLARNESPS